MNVGDEQAEINRTRSKFTTCVEVRADGELIVLDAESGIRGLGTGIEPRTPHSFSRVDDPDAADIDNVKRLCHATAPKPRVFAGSLIAVVRRQKKAAPKSFRGSLRENSNSCLRRAADEAISKVQLPRTRQRLATRTMIRAT